MASAIRALVQATDGGVLKRGNSAPRWMTSTGGVIGSTALVQRGITTADNGDILTDENAHRTTRSATPPLEKLVFAGMPKRLSVEPAGDDHGARDEVVPLANGQCAGYPGYPGQ